MAADQQAPRVRAMSEIGPTTYTGDRIIYPTEQAPGVAIAAGDAVAAVPGAPMAGPDVAVEAASAAGPAAAGTAPADVPEPQPSTTPTKARPQPGRKPGAKTGGKKTVGRKA
jgi:hypothetical protein